MGAVTYFTVGSNRLEDVKRFYDELPPGLGPFFVHPSGSRVYGRDGAFNFSVLGPFDGEPATVGSGSMVGFSFDTRDEVEALHA